MGKIVRFLSLYVTLKKENIARPDFAKKCIAFLAEYAEFILRIMYGKMRSL